MKAIGFKKHLKIDDPESLIDFEMKKPIAKGHDLLVKVNAVSVNPVDVGVRKGGHSVLKTPKVIGWDACGVVEEVGSKVSLLNLVIGYFMRVHLFAQVVIVSINWLMKE